MKINQNQNKNSTKLTSERTRLTLKLRSTARRPFTAICRTVEVDVGTDALAVKEIASAGGNSRLDARRLGR